MSDIKCEICNGNKEDENNNTLCGACTQQIENGAREAVQELETTGGYDSRLFVNSLPAYCECSVCHGAVRDPVQVEDCGHVFCASCLQTWIDRQDEPTCPNDRVVITNSFTDRSMRRVVMAMQVKCDHDQCLWKGDLHDRIEHLKRNCQHIRIRCIKDRCESVLARYELIAHIKNFCIYRSCNCLYCNQSVMFCETENHHATDCEMFPIDCQYKCQQKIPRRQLAAHENDCTERPLLCSFHTIGCPFQRKKSLLDVHLKDAVNYHLQKTVETMNQQNVVLQQQIETLQNESQQQIETLQNKSQHQIKTLQNKSQQQIETLQNKSQQQIETLQNKSQQQIETLKIENRGLRADLKTSQEEIKVLQNEMKHMHAQYVDRFEIFEIPIESVWDAKVPSASPVSPLTKKSYSKPYYTSLHGYKYRLRCSFNCRDRCYVDVYFHLMKGEYDDTLNWPFPKKIKFIFISQDGSLKSINTVDVPRGEPAFNKPTDDQNDEYKVFRNIRVYFSNGYFRVNDIIQIKCVVVE